MDISALHRQGGEPPASNYSSEIERVFETLKHGYAHLFRSATTTGHWKEVRCTALAAMCLQIREDGNSPWLEAVRNWLRAQQALEGEATGSWGEEIWDTAMCVLALKELEVSTKDPAVHSALTWMGNLFSRNGRGNWHDEPWETSWALIAVLRCGKLLPEIDVSQAIKWLASFQDQEGRIVSPHYTAYFVLLEHFSKKANIPDDLRVSLSETRERCVCQLLRSLDDSEDNKLWTGEAWANGQILWALNIAGVFPITNRKLVGKTIKWFEDTQSPDGNWSDVEDTASAILGLFALLQNLALEQSRSDRTKDITRELEARLRKAVPVPKLQIKRKLIERDDQTGYFSLNISQRTFRVVVAVLGFLLVGFLGWIANILALLEAFL